MFGLFKTVIVEDPKLGPFKRHGKRWEGAINLGGSEPVELDIEGTKEAPHPETLACAYELAERLPALIPAMSSELFEHLEPYRDALLDPDEDFASRFGDPDQVARVINIQTPEQAWAATTISGFEIGFDGENVILLIKMRTLWDIEHTVGAYFENWEFELLNGSV
jgi:hypothetical protein